MKKGVWSKQFVIILPLIFSFLLFPSKKVETQKRALSALSTVLR